jgi:hypothetical protein
MIKTFEEYKPKLWEKINTPDFRDADNFEKINDRHINAINNAIKEYTNDKFYKADFFTEYRPFRMTHGKEIQMKFLFIDIYIYLQHDNYFIINITNFRKRREDYYKCDYIEGIAEWFKDAVDGDEII